MMPSQVAATPRAQPPPKVRAQVARHSKGRGGGPNQQGRRENRADRDGRQTDRDSQREHEEHPDESNSNTARGREIGAHRTEQERPVDEKRTPSVITLMTATRGMVEELKGEDGSEENLLAHARSSRSWWRRGTRTVRPVPSRIPARFPWRCLDRAGVPHPRGPSRRPR